jgi:hypothetical protein
VGGWSNLATGRLAQFPILARRAAQVLLGEGRQGGQYVVGQKVELEVPAEFLSGSAVVQPPTGQQRPVAIDRHSGRISLVADQVGHWRVLASAGERRDTIGFAANAPAAESDLSLLTAEQIAAYLPAGAVVGRSPEELAKPQVGQAQETALHWPLGLLAVALLLAESFLANRFHRQVAPTTA